MIRFISKLLRGRRQRASVAGDFVAFVAMLPQRHEVRPEDELYSDLASARLRMIIPARQLARHIRVWLVPFTEFIRSPRLEHLGRAHATIIGKLSSAEVVAEEARLRGLLSVLRRTAPAGRLLADVSDHYAALGKAAGAPFLSEYQHGLGRACELVVPTAALAAALRRDARRGLYIVEDPFESAAAGPVRVRRGGTIQLAWFGSLSALNLPVIERGAAELARTFAERSIHLEMVAQGAARDSVLSLKARMTGAFPRFSVGFTPWSLAATEAAMERSDFVWLPQDTRESWAAVRSHNRLVSAIRAGRFALAAPIPSYQELAPYAWVGDSLADGLKWALANPEQAVERVRKGQAYVDQRFSPEVIGRRWAQILGVPPIT